MAFDPHKLVVFIGMPRSGSTSLYHIFDKHPGVFVPFRKETAFFSYNYFKGIEWFEKLYSERPPEQPGLDISPQYFNDPRTIERLKTLTPNAKLILAVRDPAEWCMSMFTQINKYEKTPDFAAFLDGYSVTTTKEIIRYKITDGYVRNTIKTYKDTFGKNLLVYKFDLFRKDPLKIINSIENFIGVDIHFNNDTYENIIVNSSEQYNLRIVSWILSRESTISVIDSFFPRDFIKKARLFVDKITTPKKARPLPALTDAEKALARERMADDKAWVDSLFETHPIQLGDGTPFSQD